MKNTGIIKEIDLNGRIVIPKEFRDCFQISQVEIFVKKKSIIISKFNSNNHKSLAFVREIDQHGRLVIPSEIRNNLEIKKKDLLKIWSVNNTMILKKYVESCIFCENTKNLIIYKDKFICNKCKEIISTL